jgi:general L-amino acid transport system substrate-binding protein
MSFFRTVAVSAALVMLASVAQAATLDDVRRKGHVQCGVSQGVPGFSNPDEQGNWTGIDVDVCRAVAAAVFGKADKVKYSPLSAKERFTALQSGEIDILSRNTTWTLVRDTALGLNFAGVNYYDGQGFMVRKDLGLKSAKELEGSSVCVNIGTTTELNMADFFRANSMSYKPVVFEKADEETISKEPLGPVVRHGDDQWLDIVKWSLYAMLEAEEYGVTSKNVKKMRNSKNPVIRRLLGKEGDLGKNLGLDAKWAYNIIKQVGNYGETYEKHVGPNTPVGLARGVNSLWTQGGLQYPMPVR